MERVLPIAFPMYMWIASIRRTTKIQRSGWGTRLILRIKNVQLGYTLRTAWSRRMKMQNLRVFASVDNLHTFTKFFQGLDPERAAAPVPSSASSFGTQFTGTSPAVPTRAAIYPRGNHLLFWRENYLLIPPV